MNNVGNLKVTAPGDREIVMTREFDAPRNLVFDAWTKPELLKRWLGALEGWSMVSARSISRWAAPIATCGAAPTGRRWGWVAFFARSCRPSV